jgi:hypothetical protein
MGITMLNQQVFLRKEILDAGIDPEKFFDFTTVADRNKVSDLELTYSARPSNPENSKTSISASSYQI